MAAEVTCSGCDSAITRRDCVGHDCFTFLKENLAKQKAKLDQQKKELRALTGIDADDRTRYPMHCYKMHPIKRYEAGTQNRRKSKVTGQWIETSDRQCVVCTRRWDSSKEPYNACGDGCDFDICDRCGCCPEGHLLEVRVQRPWEYGNVYCARCHKDQTDYVLACGVLCCSKCNWYVCRKCVPRPNNL